MRITTVKVVFLTITFFIHVIQYNYCIFFISHILFIHVSWNVVWPYNYISEELPTIAHVTLKKAFYY
jgi:hypothetical protein